MIEYNRGTKSEIKLFNYNFHQTKDLVKISVDIDSHQL